MLQAEQREHREWQRQDAEGQGGSQEGEAQFADHQVGHQRRCDAERRGPGKQPGPGREPVPVILHADQEQDRCGAENAENRGAVSVSPREPQREPDRCRQIQPQAADKRRRAGVKLAQAIRHVDHACEPADGSSLVRDKDPRKDANTRHQPQGYRIQYRQRHVTTIKSLICQRTLQRFECWSIGLLVTNRRPGQRQRRRGFGAAGRRPGSRAWPGNASSARFSRLRRGRWADWTVLPAASWIAAGNRLNGLVLL